MSFKYIIIGIIIGILGSYLYNNYVFKTNIGRKAEYPVESLIINRWSPRALSGKPISKEQIMSLFEAARWAPSPYNIQPWAFIFALKNSPGWQSIFNTLVPVNQSWAKNSSAFIVVLSLKMKNNQEIPTHSYDTGGATQNLLLQAESMGLVAHGMAGFDHQLLNDLLKIPKDYKIEAVYAIGSLGNKQELPQELQNREVPSGRNKFSDFVYENSFGNPINL